MKKRNVCMLLTAALSCSLLLTACGGGGTSTTTPGTSTPSTSTSAPAGSGGASTGAESGYTFRTSESNRVVTENGTFTKDQVSAPVLITSFGQSADVSMLDALMKKVGAEYTFDAPVIVAHMGGAARRGTLSDQFSDLALGCADYIMVVEEGNDDGKFSDAATDAGIPITMLYTIADAVTPLQEIFGA